MQVGGLPGGVFGELHAAFEGLLLEAADTLEEVVGEVVGERGQEVGEVISDGVADGEQQTEMLVEV